MNEEFIEYMNKTIEELECDDVDDEEMKGYLIQRIDIYKEILQKYKEVIDKAIEYISSQMIVYDDGEDCGVDCECDGFKLLDILKEVE